MEAEMLNDLVGDLIWRMRRGSLSKKTSGRKAHQRVALLLVLAPLLVGCRNPYFDTVCRQYNAAVASVHGNGGDFSAYWKHLSIAQGNLDPAMEDAVGTHGIDKFNELSAGIQALMSTQGRHGGVPPHITSRDVEIACK
jgi:hypothetical protein